MSQMTAHDTAATPRQGPDRLVVRPANAVRGTMRVPGDKSITHRGLLLGAIARGRSRLRDYLPSADCLNTAAALRALGVRMEIGPNEIVIDGAGAAGLTEPAGVLDLGNSGTALRLLTGLLAGQPFFSVVTGDDSLRRRPMQRVVEPLRAMGAQISGRRGGELAPLAITGRRLNARLHTLPVASAQVKSALLLAGLYADGVTGVTEPARSRDHTERLLKYFGVRPAVDGLTCRIEPQPLTACDLAVPGDLSSAAFFIVAATIVPGSELVIQNVGLNPTRTGLLAILERMGAAIRIENRRESEAEPVGDLVVRAAPLVGVTVGPEEVPQTIDEFPILCVAAAVAHGQTRIHGAGELRVKESDRIATMATELSKLGARIEERPDGLVIEGGAALAGAVCDSHGDHRIAMALAVAGLAARGETTITGAEWIETSFPGFAALLGAVTR